MSEALYRKYRPQTFEDVVGQTHIERTLKNAIEQDKVGHAYMFCGPRGTGKTTTARLLAKALLCEKGPTPAPDGTCEQCLAIAEGNHPDVYELDAASRTGVDNVREEIIGRVQYAPTRGRYKVYIIDEVHMLSIAAFNALLKTLEEPPSHVVFIMCTTDPQKVPETIQSRCQRFDFHRLSNEEIIARLGAVCTAEDVQFEGDALDLVAHRAQGGMRDALTMLEQLIAFGDGNVTMEVANDVLGSLDVDDMSGIVRSIATRDAAACFTWVSEYVETGADLARFVRDLAAYVRDLYVLSLTDGAVAVNAPQSSLSRMSGEAQMFGIDRLAYILRVLGDLNTELRTSTNPRLSFEIGLTRMVRPQSDLTLESLAARVEVLERALAQGAAAAPAAAQPAAMAQQPASVPPAANAGYRQLAAAPAVAAQPAVVPSPAQVQPTAAQPAAPASPAGATAVPSATPTASPTPTPKEESAARKDDVYTLLIVGRDRVGLNTDTIMVARLDCENHRVNIVSIPRDTLVNVPWAVKKVNSVYGSAGIDGLVSEIEDLVGFGIDSYAVVNTYVFQQIIDCIGGVYFNVPIYMYYDDPDQDLHISLAPGYQLLNGYQCEQVVRFRQNYVGTGYPYGDLGRIETQHAFFDALATQVLQLGNISNLPQIISLIIDNTDTNLSSGNIAFYAQEFLKMRSDSISFYTIPYDTVYIRGGSYVSIQLEPWLDMINAYLNPFNVDVTAANLDVLCYDGQSFTSTTGNIPDFYSFYDYLAG